MEFSGAIFAFATHDHPVAQSAVRDPVEWGKGQEPNHAFVALQDRRYNLASALQFNIDTVATHPGRDDISLNVLWALVTKPLHLVLLNLHRAQVRLRMVRAQLDDPHRGLPPPSLPTSRPWFLQAVDRQIRHAFHLLPQCPAHLFRRKQDGLSLLEKDPPGEKIHDLDCLEIRQRFAHIDEF